MTYEQFQKEINHFCSNYLPTQLYGHKSEKVIHDAVWGTNSFYQHELEIIDTPLIQRLRHINQMGFVNYVYPSARHSRLEHSLGVTTLADRLFMSLKRRDTQLQKSISQNDLFSIRLAALLHDVGHCLFSHTSEISYSEKINEFIDEHFELEASPSPHEYLSYSILTSERFNEYFNKLKNKYNLTVDINNIANMIVGATNNEEKRFLTSIINGSFDADKIDYFHRDSQFSGIPLKLDLERLYHEVKISDISSQSNFFHDKVLELTIGNKGVTCVEQILFYKMLLYSTIYHHHKVLALDCMFQGIIEYMKENSIEITIMGKMISFKDPTDFLYLDDRALLLILNKTKDENLKKLVSNILNRKLIKRIIEFNRKSIKGDGDIINILDTEVNRDDNNCYLRKLASKIHKKAMVDCLKEEIWICTPKPPSFGESNNTFVYTKNDELKQINDFYPYQNYKSLYDINKLKGYVFGPPLYYNEIQKAAKEVFKEELDIEFLC